MDPDEALRQIRLIAAQMQVERSHVAPAPGTTTANFVQHADDLAEQVQALDSWLTNGGFLPKSWQPVHPPLPPSYQGQSDQPVVHRFGGVPDDTDHDDRGNPL